MPLSQTFPVTGMSCGSCAAKVTKRLQEHPDIDTVSVTNDPPQAVISARRDLRSDELDEWLRPLGKYHVQESSSAAQPPPSAPPVKDAQTYRPLLVILGYLVLVILATVRPFNIMAAMNIFMGGFFVTFSFFKMLDLRGFADAYRGYDIVAKAVPSYGFVYPFIEFSLGLAYLSGVWPAAVNAVTAFVMAISLVGVLRAVLSKKTIRCACLGTVFNLPMSTVTIIEDTLMLVMALLALGNAL